MATLPAGTLLGKDGRYRVVKELNRGGTAVVYEGVDLTTGASVALKVMSAKEGKAAVPVKGVRREIEYAASVQHENVVKLIDFVADDRQMVIVWELISGSDLLDLLNDRGGRLDEATASNYFAQLLRAVNFIHAHGLCHRDLKPENCMVERATNKLKIIDFGLSKHQQSAVTLGVGTPDYMAPELLGGTGFVSLQERRTGHYDARACDVWAMGVLLYLLVTGQYPFEDPRQPQNVVATLQNIAAGRMRPLSQRISPACGDLIAAMLTQNPAQRITLQGISQHPWLRSTGAIGVEEAAAAAAAEAALATLSPAKDSFSFPQHELQGSLHSKTTPVTPKVVKLNAEGTMFAPGGAISPTVSPPPSVPTPSRFHGGDRVVPVTPPRPGSQQQLQGKSRIGGLCRMWFGNGDPGVIDC